MELKEGMYVRTIRGKIAKLIHFVDDYADYYFKCWEVDNSSLEPITESDILKASFNIVDLIKKDDILLGKDGKLYECWKVYKDYVFTYSKNKEGIIITLVDYQIDRVLTKEQFEQVSYKVGD